MNNTKPYNETVLERIKRDPEFAMAMYSEAVAALLDGDIGAGVAMLRVLSNAGMTLTKAFRATK